LEEIKEWQAADNHRRRIILQNAVQRRDAQQMLGKVSPAGGAVGSAAFTTSETLNAAVMAGR
jgi:hypothetical protein